MTEKFRDHLLGQKCVVYTDNNPHSHLSTAKLCATEHHWAASGLVKATRMHPYIRTCSSRQVTCHSTPDLHVLQEADPIIKEFLTFWTRNRAVISWCSWTTSGFQGDYSAGQTVGPASGARKGALLLCHPPQGERSAPADTSCITEDTGTTAVAWWTWPPRCWADNRAGPSAVLLAWDASWHQTVVSEMWALPCSQRHSTYCLCIYGPIACFSSKSGPDYWFFHPGAIGEWGGEHPGHNWRFFKVYPGCTNPWPAGIYSGQSVG